jgi:hypothetical protein
VTALWLVILALAAYRVTRLLIRDDFPPVAAVRGWLLDRFPGDLTVWEGDEVEQSGHSWVVSSSGLPVVPFEEEDGTTAWTSLRSHWIGDLIECPWCLGFWVSLIGVGSLVLWGDELWWQILAASFAISALVGLLWKPEG